MWCPEHGLNSVVVSNNVVFGLNCPRLKRSAVELLDESASDVELSTMPAAPMLQEVHTTSDLHILGIFEGNFILSDSHLEGLLSLSPSALPKVLFYTHQNNISATHLSLDDSTSLYYAVFPTQVFAQEVHVTDSSIPCNVKEALSPAFVDEWGAAIDH